LIRNNKERIVGASILLLLALILFPIIFDGQGSYQSQLTSRIPIEPAVSILQEPVQVRPVIIADTENDQPSKQEGNIDTATVSFGGSGDSYSTVTIEEEDVEISDQSRSLDAVGLPQGWSIRLGSFAETSNANNLVDRLQTAGYKAYTKFILREAGNLTSVLVGPWVDWSVADKYRKQLQDEFMLAGDIIRYEIDRL